MERILQTWTPVIVLALSPLPPNLPPTSVSCRWSFDVRFGSIVCLLERSYPFSTTNTIARFGTQAPIGLRINRESRAETLRHYKILLPHTGSLEYWDSTVDTIQHGDMLIYMTSTYLAMTLTVCPTPNIIKADLATCRFVEFLYPSGVRGLQMFVSMTKSWTKKDSSTSRVEICPNFRSYYPNMKMLRLWPDCGPDQARDAHQGLIDLLGAYQQKPPDGWAIKDDGNSIEIKVLDSTRERIWTWYLPVAT